MALPAYQYHYQSGTAPDARRGYVSARVRPPSMTTRSTTSTCTTGTVEGHHRFVIPHYGWLRAHLGGGQCFPLGSFSVAGYDWAVVFFPRGATVGENHDHAAFYVELLTSRAAAAATFDLRFVRAGSGSGSGRPLPMHQPDTEPHRFSTMTHFDPAVYGVRVDAMLMQSVQSNYVRDDRLIIDCTLHVAGKPRVSTAEPLAEIDVPPPDLPAHLGKLLDSEAHADVTFDVQGEEFTAHRVVLAMRSPVFKAELFGPMSNTGETVKVVDMQPAVFKLLLGFVYTESLAAMDDLDEDDTRELARHLLVAADRYGMGRLKIICGHILEWSLTAETVASTIALADRHGCRELKEACVEFVVAMGMNDETMTSRHEGDQLSCFSVIKHFFSEIGSFFKIH
ncbi:BTB/POZ and MATH domain-containing protein 1-like [Oryza brachyantha]|uniref:BTB/POZ and MATH domain-containing protein 1-like n=1 Tax=Oryza brachyantha TaxID=4533 RepID=UPI001ADD329E|nr:BTB/POZ and MATH domain-containing protein 1-like [Oryza brachyantha]